MIKVIPAIALAVLATGCAAPYQPTPEERAMALQMQQALLQRMQGGMMQQPMTQPTPKPAYELPTQTEADLLAAIDAITGGEHHQTISRVRDGLKIGSQMFLDPEGEIVDFGANVLSGEISYLLKLPDNSMLLKFLVAGSDKEPLTLARAVEEAAGWGVSTVTGKKLSGDKIIPTSRGFVVTRSASAFQYRPGSGIASLAATENYHIAQFQNGDIASTGYVLLEKDAPKQNDQLSQLTSIGSSLGSTLGLSELDDYLLVDVASGKSVRFDMSIEGKDVVVGGHGCKKVNSFVNKCKTLDFKESLYERDGFKNNGHYFWKISWFNTPEGTFAIAQEGGTRKITITELATGKKAVLFERMLGIAGWDVNLTPEGKLHVEAQLGFSTEHLDDAVAVLKSSVQG